MSPGVIRITGFSIVRGNAAYNHSGLQYQSSNGYDLTTGLYTRLGLNYPKFYKMDKLSQFGFLASELVLSNRKITREYPPESIAVVLANAHSSLDTDLRYAASMKTMASPALFVYTLPNILAGEICIRHGLKGENAFFIYKSFDAAAMAGYVEMVMQQPGVNACLAGWVDVMGDHHDVFLYLTERTGESKIIHSAEQIKALYQGKDYGTVDGRS